MSQNQRVLARLRQGPFAAVEFQPPGVVDGGPPIWRVAARVDALKRRGHRIRSERQPDGTAIYTLELDAERAAGNPPVVAPAPVTAANGVPPPSGSLNTELFDAGEFQERRPYSDAA